MQATRITTNEADSILGAISPPLAHDSPRCRTLPLRERLNLGHEGRHGPPGGPQEPELASLRHERLRCRQRYERESVCVLMRMSARRCVVAKNLHRI